MKSISMMSIWDWPGEIIRTVLGFIKVSPHMLWQLIAALFV